MSDITGRNGSSPLFSATDPDASVFAEQQDQMVARAKDIALTRLSRSAQTRKQLFDAAARKGIPADCIDAALDELTEAGIVDDGMYAAQYVESRRRSRGLSRRALSVELSRKGIPAEVSASVCDEISEEDDEELALQYARTKAPSVASLPRDKALRRLAGQLARRGHSPRACYEAARRALGEQG